MTDYLRDFRDVIAHGEGSRLKRDRLIRKVNRFEDECRKVGADVNKHPQGKLVESLCADGHGDFGELMFQLVAARLCRGDYSDWSGWEYRDKWAVSTYQAKMRRWRLEPVKSLAVLGEQGVGDEIMFGSCLDDVMRLVPNVVFECNDRIRGMFEREGIKTRERLNLNAERPEESFIPVGDLPRLFRKSVASFPGKPYLHTLPEMVEKWKHLRGRVGIAWRGRRGAFEPEALGIENPVCLQYDAWEFETENMTVPEIDLRNDLEDVMGIVANLSKVVTVPQTVVHIAGAIGTPVDVIVPPVTSGRVIDQLNYRYAQPRMPWYESAKVFQSLREYR